MLGTGLGLSPVPARSEPWWADAHLISVGSLGDSIVLNQAVDTALYAADVGTSRLWLGRAWSLWAAQLSGRRIWADAFATEGYSGYRTDQILSAILPESARFAIGVAGDQANVPLGVRACRPDYCLELSGTNDLTQAVPKTTAVANRVAIWSTLRDAGVEPVALSLLPRNDDPALAAQVPEWNATIAAAAETAGVRFIDTYSGCAASAGGGFKTGWCDIGNAPDPLGLHPGNEACHQMAADIWAAMSAWLPARAETPAVVADNTLATAHPDGRSKSRPLFATLGGGLFPATTGWGPRYESGATSSAAVGSDTLAEHGNALTLSYPAPASDPEFYSDRWGPAAQAVEPGRRYALTARLEFTAGHKDDSLSFGLQGGPTANALLWGVQSGGAQGVASTEAGAGFSVRDVYAEITIPPGITSVRPWLDVRTKAGGSGATVKLAQLGLHTL